MAGWVFISLLINYIINVYLHLCKAGWLAYGIDEATSGNVPGDALRMVQVFMIFLARINDVLL